MNFITSLTLAIALLGAVLGIINTVYSLNRDRIVLKVIPKWVITPNGKYIGIEAINLSYIAVGIDEVGFSLTRRVKWRSSLRLPILNPVVTNGGKFPEKLEPMFSITLIETRPILESKEFKEVKSAYARISCGLIFNGSIRALKQAAYSSKQQHIDDNV